MEFRLGAAAALALAACAAAAPAQAGVYGDDLSRCLVETATPKDRAVFIGWMFSAMSHHPDVAAFSNLTDPQRRQMAVDAGKLLQRLLVTDCRKQTVAALRYEGDTAVPGAFRLFGEVAMQGLMSHPAVEAGMGALADGVDEKQFEALALEAKAQ